MSLLLELFYHFGYYCKFSDTLYIHSPWVSAYTSTLGWIWKALEKTFSVFLIYKDSKALGSLLLMLKANSLVIKNDKVPNLSQQKLWSLSQKQGLTEMPSHFLG